MISGEKIFAGQYLATSHLYFGVAVLGVILNLADLRRTEHQLAVLR